MTGRDLIIYILENNLENQQVYEDGKLLGFMTVREAAMKFDVGVETIKVWSIIGIIPSIVIAGTIYIPFNATKKEEISDYE